MKSKKKLASLLGSCLVSLSLAIPVEAKTTWQKIEEKPSEGTIEIQENNLYKPDGTIVDIKEETAQSIDQLLNQLESGHAIAGKSGSYQNEMDASLGIVRLQFEVSGKPMENHSPISILLVMDQSGSMNMYSDFGNVSYMPCLNENHRYFLPAGTFGDHGEGYLDILKWNPQANMFGTWFGKDTEGEWVVKWVVDMLASLGPKTLSNSSENQEDSPLLDEQRSGWGSMEQSPSSFAQEDDQTIGDSENEMLTSDYIVDETTELFVKPSSDFEMGNEEDSLENDSQVHEIWETVNEWVWITPDPIYEEVITYEPVVKDQLVQDSYGVPDRPSALETDLKESFDPALEGVEDIEENQEPISSTVSETGESTESGLEPQVEWVEVKTLREIPQEPVLTLVEKQVKREVPVDSQVLDETAENKVEENKEILPSPELMDTFTTSADLSPTHTLQPETVNPPTQEGSPYLTADTKIYNSRYKVNSDTMKQWDPQSKHCYQKEDGSWQMIPVPANKPQECNGEQVFMYNYSPAPDNSYGCKDRAILSKEYAKQFAESIVQADPRNQIALELFGTLVPDWGKFKFTNNIDDLASGFSCYQGYRSTNYEDAFVQASSMLSPAMGLSSKNTSYVLFISDGYPEVATADVVPGIDPPRPNAELPFGEWKAGVAGYDAAQKLKEAHPNTKIFTVGLQVPVTPYLIFLASKPENSKNCKTMEDFKLFLDDLKGQLNRQEISNAQINDVIGEDFEFLIDLDHPLILENTSYTQLKDLPSTLKVTGKKIQWNLSKLAEGKIFRLSFYVKSDPSLIKNRTKLTLHNTNASAFLSYSPVVEDPNGGLMNGPFIRQELETPKVSFANSLITALKTNDPKDHVSIGDKITYSITLKNQGLVDASQIHIFDEVPQGTQWISGGKYDSGVVRFLIQLLKKNSMETVSFVVQVTEEAKDLLEIKNTGFFSMDENPKEPIFTNTVRNPLEKQPVVVEEVTPQKPSVSSFIRPVTSSYFYYWIWSGALVLAGASLIYVVKKLKQG